MGAGHTGTAFDDTIIGDDNDNTLIGQDGNDTIYAAGGDDWVFGGRGDDLLDGGDGIDFLVYNDVASAVNVDLSITTAQDTGGGGIDTVSGFEILAGGSFNDVLRGDDGDNDLRGLGGNDILAGGGGNDTLRGGYGDDIYIFEAGGGFDTIIDQSGNDILQIGEGITAEQITFTQIGDDLFIDIASGVTIVGQFASGTASAIEFIAFEETNEIVTVEEAMSPNRDPIATDDNFTVNEDIALTGNVLANDTDEDGDSLSVVEQTLTTSTGATVEVLANGDFTYTPLENAHGSDSFTYTINDGNDGIDTATVNVDVLPVNDLPIAQDDNFTTDEDTQLSGNVLANDTDPDGDTLSVVEQSVATAAGGTVLFFSSGGFTYSPDANFYGQDSFTYTVDDGAGGQAVASATVEVAPVNDAPVAEDDSFDTDEDVQLSGNILTNDTDPDGDTLSVVEQTVATAAGGTVLFFSSGNFTYDSAANFFGQDSFTYTIDDGNGGVATATATLNVAPVNDAPVAQDDAFDGLLDTEITGNVLDDNGSGQDSDIDGDPLSVVAESVTTASGGLVTIEITGEFTYTPDETFMGVDSFTYTVLDGQGGMDTATVTLNVSAPTDNVRVGDDGFDFMRGTGGGDTLLGLGGRDLLFGRDGDDYLYGNDGRDLLFGGDNNDVLKGGEGDDKLFGQRGDDMLAGGDGDDWLSGSFGDDVLAGGAGSDTLYGGGGADVFVFEAETAFTGLDEIQDFSTRFGDSIDISDVLESFDPMVDAIEEFVRISYEDNHHGHGRGHGWGRSEAVLEVDADGGRDNFRAVAEINNGRHLQLDDLVDSGALILQTAA